MARDYKAIRTGCRARRADWTRQFDDAHDYDALNRPVASRRPTGSVALPGYNEASLLERLDVHLRGAADADAFVANIDYNARGQRTLIDYGNGARRRHVHDEHTFGSCGC